MYTCNNDYVSRAVVKARMAVLQRSNIFRGIGVAVRNLPTCLVEMDEQLLLKR